MENYTEKDGLCFAPWNLLRIETDGYCYTCSSAYVRDFYCLGNIFTDDISEIWNGEKAQNFRKDKLSREYKYCKTEQCHLFARNMNHYSSPPNNDSLLAEWPKYVSLSYDNSCSERCVFCRDNVIVIDKNTAQKWENILHYRPFFVLLQHEKAKNHSPIDTRTR